MYTPINGNFSLLDALIVAFIAILIVFIVLALIIIVASIFSKIIIEINKKNNINSRIENKIIEEDEDALAAVIVASIDYYNETKKHAKLVSITKEEE